jgi:hypothetical protein
MRVYKFMPSKFVDDFRSRGCLKISTLAECRVPDGKTGARSDEFDGVAQYQPGQTILSGAMADAFWARLGMVNNKRFKFGFDEQTIFKFQGDGYLFCTSNRLNRVVVRRMREDFGADACVCIRDLETFANLVTDAIEALQGPMSDDGSFGAINRVRYRRIDTTVLPSHVDPFIKRPEYGWQWETRIFWPGAEPHVPIITEVPSVVGLLSPVDLRKWL